MKNSSKKYPYYFYLLAILFPFILPIISEVLLRFSDYGEDYSIFVKLDNQFSDFLFFNPKLPKKYFSGNLAVPSVIPDAFLEKKPKNGFRIFVLGESSVAGFPYPPNVSFPRFIKRKLEIYYPEKFIEVINLGVSAINTNSIKDIAKGIIEYDPDLILIYTGHNEYYGAYGAASSNSLFLNNLIIGLREYRVYQLIENLFQSMLNLFSDDKNSGKTLMASMVGKNLVEKNSKEFQNGIVFFSANMKEIFTLLKSHNIPVITSTLISNEMQKPLESSIRLSQAQKLFDDGLEFFQKSEFTLSKNYFKKAKEYDALRFRAPQEINSSIRNFAEQKLTYLLDAEKYFRKLSKTEILGNEFFVDHLHLNIGSNKFLADLFIEKILELNILKLNSRINNEAENIDYLLNENIPFTKLDSSYSAYSIALLTNTFPFTKNKDARIILSSFHPKNIIDSLALSIIRKEISLDKAHFELAINYYKKQKYFDFYKEMNSLIEDKPFEKSNYYNAVNMLINKKQNQLAFPILKKLEHRFPDVFCYKKLSDLYFENQNFKVAKNYLLLAKNLSPQDAEIYFKLSRIDFIMKNFDDALKNIKRCIELKPDYPNAANIYEKLRKEFDKK